MLPRGLFRVSPRKRRIQNRAEPSKKKDFRLQRWAFGQKTQKWRFLPGQGLRKNGAKDEYKIEQSPARKKIFRLQR